LIRVNGTRIIDTLLDAALAAGIEEIIIIRGYLGERFDQLLYKYPMVKFIDNPYYNEANNISSVLCAGDLVKNAYVIESDLLLSNHALITKYQYYSNYLGVPTGHTDDWCFETDRDGVITKIKVGGDNCHHMFGISYWTEADGAKLSSHIKQVYEMPNGKNAYWDEVALKYFIGEYTVKVRECTFDGIVEIDTFSELQRLDKTYIPKVENR
jgi:CTP:phosphocholine cytidylyltransferase-like protein